MAIPALAPVDRPADESEEDDEELAAVPLEVLVDEAAEVSVAVEPDVDDSEESEAELVSAAEVAAAVDEA